MQNNSIYEIFSPNPCSSIRIRIFVYGANKCVRVSVCVHGECQVGNYTYSSYAIRVPGLGQDLLSA